MEIDGVYPDIEPFDDVPEEHITKEWKHGNIIQHVLNEHWIVGEELLDN